MSRPTISDADIEAVARRMCIELGINPDVKARCGDGDESSSP